jgi:stringent starvation protein B
MALDAAYTCHMSEESFRMSSHRPYLLRALVEWINDNGMTPHIMVDAGVPGVQVPASAVKDERVVLNIAERAVMRLHIDNDAVSFTARFSGVSFPVNVPIAAVLAVYARETGQGMALPDDIPGTDGPESHDDDTPPPTPPDPPQPSGKRPFLRVVK